ncbi:MAG: hypothetical protein MZV65_20760 [Chromatiales bacterium]|nr:hypothetical protein [Chromatiales bacterium]
MIKDSCLAALPAAWVRPYHRCRQGSRGCTVSGALERPGHPLARHGCRADRRLRRAWTCPSPTTSTQLVEGCDVLIDFTTPKVSLKNLEVCGLNGKAMVIGSTGFTPEERAAGRAELARTIPGDAGAQHVASASTSASRS